MNKENQVKSRTFAIRMIPGLHKEVKLAAAMRNISMSLLIHRAIYQYLRILEIDKE